MTGNEIKALRTSLRMNVPQFAELVGVHVTTAYRWEGFAAKSVDLDRLQLKVLTHLQQRLDEQKGKERDSWVDGLLKMLLVGGTLVALAYILANLTKGKKP